MKVKEQKSSTVPVERAVAVAAWCQGGDEKGCRTDPVQLDGVHRHVGPGQEKSCSVSSALSMLSLGTAKPRTHMGQGGTDRSIVGNSKKRYYPINFWILVVK